MPRESLRERLDAVVKQIYDEMGEANIQRMHDHTGIARTWLYDIMAGRGEPGLRILELIAKDLDRQAAETETTPG